VEISALGRAEKSDNSAGRVQAGHEFDLFAVEGRRRRTVLTFADCGCLHHLGIPSPNQEEGTVPVDPTGEWFALRGVADWGFGLLTLVGAGPDFLWSLPSVLFCAILTCLNL